MNLPGMFITGTDTGVGKTVVAAAIARILTEQGVKVGVLKPIATGARNENGEIKLDDAEFLREAIGGGGVDLDLNRICPIVFDEPLAPSVASRRAGELLSLESIKRKTEDAVAWWSDRAEFIVVEGVGGLYCPLAEEATVADLAEALDYPLVIVGRKSLGTLNHVLMTVESARLRGLRIAGVVLNEAEPSTNSIAEATNAHELARRLDGVAILADLPRYDSADDPKFLDMMRTIDWRDLFKIGRRVDPSPALGDPAGIAWPPGDLDAPDTGNDRQVADLSIRSDDGTSVSPSLFSTGSGEGVGLALTTGRALEPDPLLDAFAHGADGRVEEIAPKTLIPPTSPKILSVLDSDASLNAWPDLARSNDEGDRSARDSRRGRGQENKPTLGRVLLHSYASAMTLACAWLFWANWKQARQRPARATAQAPGRESPRSGVTEEGERGENSRVVEPPKPIAADHRIALGQALKLGSLEIVPLEVRRGKVQLAHVNLGGGSEKRSEGDRALRLKLRLRNLSDTEIFAPVDEAFVRDPDAGLPDSYIEAEPNLRVYTFSLAVGSEWSIVGQNFREVRPGETFETIIVSAPDAFVDLADDTPLLWRVRLRVGIASNEVVGVSFQKKEIK